MKGYTCISELHTNNILLQNIPLSKYYFIFLNIKSEWFQWLYGNEWNCFFPSCFLVIYFPCHSSVNLIVFVWLFVCHTLLRLSHQSLRTPELVGKIRTPHFRQTALMDIHHKFSVHYWEGWGYSGLAFDLRTSRCGLVPLGPGWDSAQHQAICHQPCLTLLSGFWNKQKMCFQVTFNTL